MIHMRLLLKVAVVLLCEGGNSEDCCGFVCVAFLGFEVYCERCQTTCSQMVRSKGFAFVSFHDRTDAVRGNGVVE
jgi:hypothetical protein